MNTEEYFFETLKKHRESKDIGISEICDFTKINPKYIEGIESGDFTLLPVVYMRLFLREYANFIGVDADKALEDYELYTTGKVKKREDADVIPLSENNSTSILGKDLTADQQITPKQIAIGASIIVGVFLILYWAGQVTSQQQTAIENEAKPIYTNEQTEIIYQDSLVNSTNDPKEEIDKKKDQ